MGEGVVLVAWGGAPSLGESEREVPLFSSLSEADRGRGPSAPDPAVSASWMSARRPTGAVGEGGRLRWAF